MPTYNSIGKNEEMMKNISLRLDEDLIRKIKFAAARKQISVSQLVTMELYRAMQELDEYELAKQKAVSDMKSGFGMGGKITVSREELHAR